MSSESPPLSDLRAADDALGRGDRARALDALLEAWRVAPAPAVADLIDRLGAEIDRAATAPSGRTRAALHEQWIDLAGSGRATDVGPLLQTLAEGRSPMVAERLERLAPRPADPRVAARLVGLVEAPPWTAGPSRPAWRLVFRILASIADPRCAARLQARRAAPGGPGGATFRKALDEGIDAVLARTPPPPPLPEEAPAVLASIGARVEALLAGPPGAVVAVSPAATQEERSEEDFIRLIAEDPDDDGRRHVFADWLLERGDPRGELMVAQLERHAGRGTAAGRKREKALVRELGPALVGALEPVLEKKSLVFERGRLAACATRFRTPRQRRELRDHPLWATVRDLSTEEVELATSPAMRALRTLRGIGPAALARVCDHGAPLAIEEVWLDYPADTPAAEQHDSIARARALPGLRHLAVRLHGLAFRSLRSGSDPPFGPHHVRWLVEGEVVGRLERLTFTEQMGRHGLDLAGWVGAITGRFRVPRLDLEMGGASLRLVRDEAGALSLLVHCAAARFWMHAFEETLRGVPWADLARVEVTWDEPPAAMDRLRAALVHPNISWPAERS